jgi:hypothetical protein
MVHERKIIVYIATSADGFIARPEIIASFLDEGEIREAALHCP